MILYCPIDIPKVPEIHLDGLQAKNFYHWNFYAITTKKKQYGYNEILENFAEKNPEFVEWINYLPWSKIVNIKYNYQVSEVEPHIDFTSPNDNLKLYNNNFFNEPCGYRCVIKGKRENALYVVGKDMEKKYAEVPFETDTYVINHTTGMHGVNDEDKRQTLFFHFEIDSEKHQKLLQRSCQKYKDYIISI